MVVKDLLMQCLTDDIIKVVWKKGYENANIDKVYNSYSPLITELKNRIPNISDYVILGIDWINFGEPMPDCVLYNINEIKTEFKINDKFEKISDVNILSDSEIEELINDYKHPNLVVMNMNHGIIFLVFRLMKRMLEIWQDKTVGEYIIRNDIFRI